MAFDVKTIFTLIILINVVISLVLIFYKIFVGVKLSGLYLIYALGKLLQAIGLGLTLFREELPGAVFIILTNVFLYHGFSLEFFSFSTFGDKNFKKKLVLFLALAVLFSIIFAFNVHELLGFRIFISFLIFAIMALIAGVDLITVKPKSRMKRITAVMLLLVSFVMVFRALDALMSQYIEVLFMQSLSKTLAYAVYFVITFVFTINFILLSKEEDEQTIVSNGALLNNIIDNLPIGLEIFNAKGFCSNMNKSMKDILDLPSVKDVIGKFNILTDPICIANGIDKPYRKAYKGETINHEITVDFGLVENEYLTRKDKRIFQETIFPIFDEFKSVSHVVTLIWDLTELRNKEQELKLSKEKFELVFQSSPIGKALYNPDGHVLLINKKVTELFGYTIDEIPTIGEWINKAYPSPEEREKTIVRWEQYIQDKKGNSKEVLGFESTITSKDGIRKHIELNFEDIGDLRITTFVDVTDRKNYIDEIQRIKGLLAENERLFDMGAWEYNVDTQEMIWSDGLYNIHDFDKEEDIDHISESLKCYSDEDREKVDKAFQDCINKGTAYNLICRFTTRTGNEKWIKTITKPVFDSFNKVQGVIGVLVDISEHISIENKLKELNATKDKLFSIIGHDLRTPIGNLVQLADLMIAEAENITPDKFEEYIKLIKTSSEKSFELLNNLLDWSRLSIGSMSLSIDELNIYESIEGTAAMFKPMFLNKNISLINSIPKDLVLKADLKMIQTVFRNLISNALKFTPQGGTIELNVQTENGNAIISVSDTGVGMSESEVEKLFNSTDFISKNGTLNEKGSGLGLKLCQEFINLHNGCLRVKSEVNKGTTFYVCIPKV